MRGVGEGFAFLRTQPVLLMTFVVDIIAMVFAWPQAVFPELTETRFADSPNALGWLFAGVSIGALLMGLTSGWVSRVDRQGAVVHRSRSSSGAWRSSASGWRRRCGWRCCAWPSPAPATW